VDGGRGPLWPPPPPDAASAETGQFTRLFGSRLPGEAIDIEKEHASAAGSAAPENRPFQQAGEFTRRFGPQPGAAGSPPPAQDVPPQALNATLVRSASGLFGSPDEMAKVAKAALGRGKQPDAGPGEYTLLFDSPKKPEEAGPPAAPKASVPETAPRRSRNDLVVIVVSIVVLVSLLVMAIVLRKH
jgi:hypothetical protein